MGNKIKIPIYCELIIDEDTLRETEEGREEDIQEQIKWAIQRVENQYDERVSWSIDYYLNEYMPKWLTSLKPVEGEIQGIPMQMYSEKELSDPNGISEESSLKAKVLWGETLDIMIAGFEAAKEIEKHCIVETEDSEEWKTFHLGMDTFKKYYFCLWD